MLVYSAPPAVVWLRFLMEPGSDHCPGAIRAGSGAYGLMTVPGRGWGDEGDRAKSIPYKRPK